MQNEKVPEWAFVRMAELASACRPANVLGGVSAEAVKLAVKQDYIANAFARYIAEHEEPPVDELYEALKAVVEMGRYDTREQTELLRRELRDRGLEVRKTELARKEDSHAG